MKIIPIFVSANPETEGGLYAIQYGEETNEFSRLFNSWHNKIYLLSFCKEHKEDLLNGIHRERSIDEAILSIEDEAYELEGLLLDYTSEGFKDGGNNLQMLFKALDNSKAYEFTIKPLQQAKASVKNRYFPIPKLRFYGLRFSPNLFIITGGAIKLNLCMNDREHLRNELKKLKTVQAYLVSNNIITPEDLISFL